MSVDHIISLKFYMQISVWYRKCTADQQRSWHIMQSMWLIITACWDGGLPTIHQSINESKKSDKYKCTEIQKAVIAVIIIVLIFSLRCAISLSFLANHHQQQQHYDSRNKITWKCVKRNTTTNTKNKNITTAATTSPLKVQRYARMRCSPMTSHAINTTTTTTTTTQSSQQQKQDHL